MSVSRTGSPVLAHDDLAVAVVAMLPHDIDSLARWVSAMLGPLAANTRNAERLRETLLAFPASGAVTSARPTGCSCTATPSSTGSPAP